MALGSINLRTARLSPASSYARSRPAGMLSRVLGGTVYPFGGGPLAAGDAFQAPGSTMGVRPALPLNIAKPAGNAPRLTVDAPTYYRPAGRKR